MTNNSPWIAQLNFKRRSVSLLDDATADVAVIGGGIAGLATAYFLLQHTDKSVVLLEADKIAHGATGHNAGQLVSYFERDFTELVEEFGLEQAAAGQAAVESAWQLLEGMIADAALSLPLHRFTGYDGYSTLEQLLSRLEEDKLRHEAGLRVEEILVADDPLIQLRIPDEYVSLYRVVGRQDISDLLETTNHSYIAAKGSAKGCMNSALLCEQLAEWLEESFNGRFWLYEASPVKRLRLTKNNCILECQQRTVIAEHTVLCTNGFESIQITNENGVDIDGRFHECVEGTIGYMGAFISHENRPPTALSYFEASRQSRLDPYVYLTRRPHEGEGRRAKNLICVGGPEIGLDDKSAYDRSAHPYPSEAQVAIDGFMKRNFRNYPQETKYDFTWHGLMGYTKNGVRLIGFEPCNHHLLYNLGCNGVGLLPSIYGASRISRLLSGEILPPSMFDVQDKRCFLPQ